jgi:serine-type D-Ala-D-Ala carboxypeptidase
VEATSKGAQVRQAGPLADAVSALMRADGVGEPPPGVVLAVRSPAGDQVEAEGWAQTFDEHGPLPTKVPMKLDTRIDLASVTKIVATTTSVMALVDGGELRLDVRLDALLPWMQGRPAAAATIGELLGHRAGLWEWWPLYLRSAEAESALEQASSLPLRYEPGRARHYSDLGFQLLGAVVARVAGTELTEAVDALVLRPFGLDHTRYAAPVAGRRAVATSLGDRIEREMVASGRPYPVTGDVDAFAGWRTRVLVGEVNDGNAFHAYGGRAGHAGLFSTVPDLLRCGEILLDCLDGSGPISAATLQRFLTPGPDPAQALGFRSWDVETAGTSIHALGHTGFPGVGLAIVPERRAVVVLSTNRLHVPGASRATEEMFLAALVAAGAHLCPTTATATEKTNATDKTNYREEKR